MSLEENISKLREAIDRQTEALVAQAETNTALVNAVRGLLDKAGEATASSATAATGENDAKTAGKRTGKTTAKTPPAEQSAQTTTAQTAEERGYAIEEPADVRSGLPAGERNRDYFDKYIRPILQTLAEADASPAKDVLRGVVSKFGVAKASEIPADKWDDLIIDAKASIERLKAAGDMI